MTTNAPNNAHANTKLTPPYPPFSAKSNSTCQSNTDAENAENTSPANATHVRRIFRPAQSACAMNASHAPPTNTPISTSNVRCELTSVRTVIPSGNMNADAISPDFPNPTPSGFTAKSFSPASQIFGRFITAPSSASLGHIHHAAIQAKHADNITPHMVVRALRARRHPSHIIHHAPASNAKTMNPVRENVAANIAQSTTLDETPTHRPLFHPQQNGITAQIAAAAWFGLKNPNPILTKSPATNSILYAF